MEKEIIKYLEGRASEQERQKLAEWVALSEENRAKFASAKEIHSYAQAQLLSQKGDNVDIKSNFEAFKKIVQREDKKYQFWKKLVPYAASAVLILAISLVSYNKLDRYKSQLNFISKQGLTSLEYFTPTGVKSKIVLPDSSVVWLNSASKISLPSKFTGDIREVDFEGEGYFEVKKDSAFPMVIRLKDGMNVVVKGTKFNLSAYSDDSDISLLLLSGKVSLETTGGKEIAGLIPNQKIFVDRLSRKIKRDSTPDTLTTTGWKKGYLIFEDCSMSEVIKKIERWYGVKIRVADAKILDKNFTATFKDESISRVLDLMERVSLVRYSLNDSIVSLYSYNN